MTGWGWGKDPEDWGSEIEGQREREKELERENQRRIETRRGEETQKKPEALTSSNWVLERGPQVAAGWGLRVGGVRVQRDGLLGISGVEGGFELGMLEEGGIWVPEEADPAGGEKRREKGRGLDAGAGIPVPGGGGRWRDPAPPPARHLGGGRWD